jgi:hypothetical protein
VLSPGSSDSSHYSTTARQAAPRSSAARGELTAGGRRHRADSPNENARRAQAPGRRFSRMFYVAASCRKSPQIGFLQASATAAARQAPGRCGGRVEKNGWSCGQRRPESCRALPGGRNPVAADSVTARRADQNTPFTRARANAQSTRGSGGSGSTRPVVRARCSRNCTRARRRCRSSGSIRSASTRRCTRGGRGDVSPPRVR